jgi:protein-disulfide isomerase
MPQFAESPVRDNARMTSEAAATPIPRRGRVWVILALAVALAAVGYAIVDIATKEPGRDVVRVEGIGNSQELFGGVPQEGDRFGSSDAPVSIQVFADLQCGDCRDDFLATIPGLAENYARPGEAQLLLRHYSIARNPLELGFFGAEAAAEQNYGWQYTYLFFVNQDEARRFGVGDELMESLAGAIGNLDIPEWKDYLEQNSGSGGAIAARLDEYAELGLDLGIRSQVAMVVSGPTGTRTLQDGPSLAEVERAIAAVGGKS